MIQVQNMLNTIVKNEDIAETNDGKLLTEQTGWRSNGQIINEMIAQGAQLEAFRAEHYHTGYFTETQLEKMDLPSYATDKIDQERNFKNWEAKRQKMIDFARQKAEEKAIAEGINNQPIEGQKPTPAPAPAMPQNTPPTASEGAT